MKTYQKVIIGIIAVLAIAGAYMFPKTEVVKFVGAAGDITNSSQPVASQDITVASTTISSFYNGSGRSRIVTSSFIYLNGFGSTTADMTFRMATTTGSSGIGAGYVVNMTLASTTSDVVTYSTSTPSATGFMLWPTGTYLNTVTSALANSTTTGIVGVSYLTL